MSIETILPWVVVALLTILVGYLAFRLFQTTKRYKPIIDADSAVRERQKKCDSLEQQAAKFKAKNEKEMAQLRDEYAKKKTIFEELAAQVSLYEENLEAASFGLYQPHFDFDASEQYKDEIRDTRATQKQLISNDGAARCDKKWVIEGSEAKGRAATKRFKKLLIRGFNGECDGLIAKVSWDNASRMDERMEKAYEALNKLGNAAHGTYVTQEYLNLKRKEMELTYEYQMKRQEEREEQRRIKEQIREEERAEREIQKALREAAVEEKRKADALAEARAEAAEATGEKLTEMEAKIAGLTAELADAHEKSERAISRAQQTRAGHVYVISNVGSFGDDVFKVGMTRRLEPLDRVKELGDASVPFEFDVHAMIWSEDAPGLEGTFHQELTSNRVNKVNHRKEFFRVDLGQLRKIAADNGVEVEFTMLAEAKEFRETQALEKAEGEIEEASSRQKVFPSEI